MVHPDVRTCPTRLLDTEAARSRDRKRSRRCPLAAARRDCRRPLGGRSCERARPRLLRGPHTRLQTCLLLVCGGSQLRWCRSQMKRHKTVLSCRSRQPPHPPGVTEVVEVAAAAAAPAAPATAAAAALLPRLLPPLLRLLHELRHPPHASTSLPRRSCEPALDAALRDRHRPSTCVCRCRSRGRAPTAPRRLPTSLCRREPPVSAVRSPGDVCAPAQPRAAVGGPWRGAVHAAAHQRHAGCRLRSLARGLHQEPPRRCIVRAPVLEARCVGGRRLQQPAPRS